MKIIIFIFNAFFYLLSCFKIGVENPSDVYALVGSILDLNLYIKTFNLHLQPEASELWHLYAKTLCN